MKTQTKKQNKMEKFNELMKLTTSMNMDLQKIIFKKVEENMKNKPTEITSQKELVKFMGSKVEDEDGEIIDVNYIHDEEDFENLYKSPKGQKWLGQNSNYYTNNYKNKFGDIVCSECCESFKELIDGGDYIENYRGNFICGRGNCKADHLENLLYIAERKLKNNTDELLLKYDKDNHFKIFSRILLPQFVHHNEYEEDGKKEDNKRLKNLYTYFKRVNLDYGLRPYPNNKNKYYRKYHKNANIENVEVKYIPDK